jgi:1,4-dihydroxy-2-naphthoyl-CoA hydrolase
MDVDLEVVNSDMRGPFVNYLGLEYTEVSGDRVVATWTAGERHHQPYGIVHGGVHASIVETLGSIGSAAWLGHDGKCVGVNNTTDFYRAAREGEMTSVATPIHRGRSQQVWLVETHDGEGRLVARGQLRVQNLTG